MDYAESEARTTRIYPITFHDCGKLQAIPVPVARISLCGMIEVEVLTEVISSDPPQGRYEVVSPQRLRGRGAVPSLMLLKLLVSCSHRFATSDWLSEHMHGEMEGGALVRLDTIASYLRGVLCHIKTEREEFIDALRLVLVAYLRNGRGSGPGYQLAPYPLLWIDTDALAYHGEHATIMERMGEPSMALPFWQRAYQLTSRGIYLPDETASDWAAEMRERVAGMLRQSVHAQRRFLLLERGEAAKEEVILLLRNYWQAHKTDEDALRPLMELLGEQERFGEVEEYYQQCCIALEQEELDKQPAKQTQDLREFLRTKQIRRDPKRVSSALLQETRLSGTDLSASSLVHVIQLSQTSLHKTVFIKQGMLTPPESGMWLPPGQFVQTPLEAAFLDIATWFGTRVNDLKALGMYQQELTFSCQQQQAMIYGELKRWNTMTDQDHHSTNEYFITRRMALATLATLSTSLLTKVQLGSVTTFVIEEFITQCSTSLTTCWHLMQGREFAIVQQALTGYLPVLSSWTKHPSSYQKTSAYLAAQGCLLMGLLSLHSFPIPQNFQKRALYCTQATEYAHLSADPILQITVLTHLANAQYDMGQLGKMLQTYQKAVSTLEGFSKQYQFPSLLRSKLQVELAHAYAQHGQVQKSLRALEEARAFFSDESEAVPVFLSTDYGHHSLILFEGLTHLDLEKHAPGNNHSHQAATALAEIESVSMNEPIPERFRVEIINQQALAAIREGNLDNFRRYFLEGTQGAKELESEKRRQETIANWKAAREQWPHEQRILELADMLF